MMEYISAHVGYGACCVSLVLISLLTFERHRLAKRLARSEATITHLSREAGALSDDLLQSMQGLLLTLYVAVQRVSLNQTARQNLNKVFTKADRAVIEGRDRFEQLQLRATGKNLCHKSSDREETPS